jgi:hypothetical protein
MRYRKRLLKFVEAQSVELGSGRRPAACSSIVRRDFLNRRKQPQRGDGKQSGWVLRVYFSFESKALSNLAIPALLASILL